MKTICLTTVLCFQGLLLEAANPRPNIILAMADDQGWGDMGYMGHKVLKTPHLARLAAERVVFPRGYVPTSLCRPSLASMVSGLYPHQHKITGNDPPRGTDRKEMLRHIKTVSYTHLTLPPIYSV